MNRKWLLALVIVLVDLATAANLFEMESFFELGFFALLITIAYLALQLGCLVLFSYELPTGTRCWLFAGTAVLVGIMAVSNVAMAFLRSAPIFPAATLVPVLGFGVSAQELGVRASYFFGIGLQVVSLIFWSALGEEIRRERREKDAAKQELFRIDSAYVQADEQSQEQAA